MSKYTEGPWKLEGGRTIVTKDGTFHLAYFTDEKTGTCGFPDFCALDANARLVSAAPELLAACKDALGYRMLTHHGEDECLATLNAAIAKAEGENNA